MKKLKITILVILLNVLMIKTIEACDLLSVNIGGVKSTLDFINEVILVGLLVKIGKVMTTNLQGIHVRISSNLAAAVPSHFNCPCLYPIIESAVLVALNINVSATGPG